MPLTNQTKSRRNYHRRVAGPMGRPALLGSRPRGPQYRGVQRPPHYGNRPWERKSNQNARHEAKTPKGWARLLAGPRGPNTIPITKHKDGNYNIAENNPTRTAHMYKNDADINTAGGPLPGGGGGAAWRRPGPNTPPPLSHVSEIAAISGVHDGHRNRKSQKSLRFRCAKAEALFCVLLSPSLIFLSLLFWEKQGKPPICRTPKILGKKGIKFRKTLKKARKFVATKKARKSKKARKIRVLRSFADLRLRLLRSFALFFAHLRSFALICVLLRPTAFRTNDRVWELLIVSF